MIRLWRSLIGIAWGAIVGAFAMHFVSKIFGYEIALINCIVYGIPTFFGFIGGVTEEWWYDFWKIIVYPIISLFFVVIVLLIIIVIALLYDSLWHLLWIIPLISLFVPATEYVVLIFKK